MTNLKYSDLRGMTASARETTSKLGIEWDKTIL